MKKQYLFLIFIFSLFLFNPVFAQEIKTLSAGVSDSDRAERAEFSLKLVFFEKDRPYLAYIEVEIYDNKKNQILKTLSVGPWLFVDLPRGDYQVIAMRKNGDKQSARFSINSDRQKEVALAFPKQE